MLYIFLIVAIIGLSLWLEAQSRAERDSEEGSVENGNRKSAYPQESFQRDDLASARDFVEQLKRQRAEEQGYPLPQHAQENSLRGEEIKRAKHPNYSPTPVRKGRGKNYVDNSFARKNIAKIERARVEYQKRVQQIQAQVEQINSAEFSVGSKSQPVPENDIEVDSSLLFPKDRASLQRAFIASEILSKPVSLRK